MRPKPIRMFSRAAMLLLTLIFAFAGARTTRAENTMYVIAEEIGGTISISQRDENNNSSSFTANKIRLTFYYGERPSGYTEGSTVWSQRTASIGGSCIFDVPTSADWPAWYVSVSEVDAARRQEAVVEVQLDPSFAAAKPTSTAYWFQYMENLRALNLNDLDVSKLTNAKYMFTGCTNLKNIYCESNWDRSKLTTSSNMFRYCTSLPGYNVHYVDKAKAKPQPDGYFTAIGLTYKTAGRYYEINDEQDLIDLGNYTNATTANTCEGMTFKLTRDLDFSSRTTDDCQTIDGEGNFIPLKHFKGTFDGQGHTITGLRFNGNMTALTGLFARTYYPAVIQNVTVVSPTLNSGEVGGIVGTAQGGTISNCTVVGGTLNSTNNYAGGIIGYMKLSEGDGIISDCTVVNTSISGGSTRGIIAGIRNNNNYTFTISNCNYHNPSDLPVCGGSNGYTDGGGNQQVYQARLADGLTAIGATYSYGQDYYYASGATVTLAADREGYVFLGYTATGVTLSGSATSFTMPASDVTIGAEWADPADFSVNAAGTEYIINTAAGWGQFCDLLEGNDKGFFSGKTVKLAYDISVSRMAGASYHDFIGTFDGNQKTLTFNYTTSAENAAPFQYVENATIKNLHVAGTIQTSNKYAAGIIAQQYGTVSIQNCRSSVVINSSINGDGTHGGLVAVNNNSASLTIDGCVFDGKLLSTGTTATTATTNCGGFVGYSNSNKGATATVTNSLYTPAALESGETECTSGSYTFVRNGSAGDNCYYTRTLGTAQGTWEGEPDFVKRGDGAGTSANPYKITNANDLKDLAVYVNGTGTYSNGFSETTAHNCSDVYFQQTNPITLTSAWTPIGNAYANPFKGHYDGGGYQITGLNVTTNGQYAGLFGYIVGGQYQGSVTTTMIANVNNVVLVNPTITVTATSSAQYAGAVVGYAGTCTGVSYNTIIGGTVSYTGIKNYNTNNSYAGGVVGYYSSVHFSLLTYNKVSGITVSGGGISGGVTGYAQYSYQILGNVVDANVSSAEFDLHTDIHTYGYRQGVVVGYCDMVSSGSPSNPSNVNYYHSVNGLTAYGANASYHSFNPVADGGYNAQIYTITTSDNLTVSDGATATIGTKSYFAAGATATLSTDDSHIFKDSPTVSGTGASVGNVAANKKSATVTVGTADVTVSATLQTVSGTSSDGLTWSLTQDNSGNYTVLTISGSGAMKNYGHDNADIWRTDAPWGWQLTSVTIGNGVTSIGNFAFIGCQSLASITIGTGVTTIGENAFDHCDAMTSVTLPASVTSLNQGAFKNCVGLQSIDIQHDGAVSLAGNVFQNDNALLYIVFPSIAAEQANTTGNWSGFASKRRAKFGNQHFGVTTEGGTAAYQIATDDDLRNLAAAVNATGNYASTGKTFRQTADIDLAGGGNFTPIGELAGSYSFAGTYDGGGYTISGLTVSINYGSIGLFGEVKGATVRNVILLSPTAKATTTIDFSVDLGALIGRCASGSSNLVENCHVVNPTVSSSSTYSKNYVGAIIGNIWNTNTTATNCYYYGGNANAACGYIENGAPVTRVCAAHLVTLADGVTIQTAMADELGFSCDSDNDGTPENYWREGAELTLDNTLGEAPEYYALNYATTAGTINGSTLTVGNADATVSAAIRSDGQPHSITYMKADGTTGQADAIALDGYETAIKEYGNYNVHLAAGTYYVGHDISYDYKIVPDGDITLILGNGKTMTLASNVTGIQGVRDLTIYGQSLDPATAGTLRYDGTSSRGIYVGDYTQHSGNVTLICSNYNGVALEANTVTLNGGKLTITANSTNARAINASMTVTITGGQLDATATGTNAVGILTSSPSYGDITLGWTNADDYIHVSSYKVNQSGTVKIADGQSIYNGSEVLSGTITDMSKLNGKTLRPYKTITLADAADNSSTIREWNGSVADVTLQGRTLTKDGNWNTLCLPFSMTAAQIAASPLAGATIKEMATTSNLDANGVLTLNFSTVTAIEAGTPYIIKWTTTGDDIVNPVFSNVTISSTTPTAVESYDHTVTFVGQYSPFSIVESGATGSDQGNKNEILLMTKGNKIGYSKNPRTLKCFRCHFYVPTNGGQQAHSIEVDFGEGEATALSEELRVKSEELTGSWYSLDGRKLEGKPTAKGMYIVNGRKVIIK